VNRRAAPLLALGAALAVPSAAQTPDPLFARWSWAPQSQGSRPAGLGGAYVGIADGVKAAHANPAGLSLIPVRELNLSSGRPWFAAGSGLGPIRAAAYVAKTDDQRAGSLQSSVWETGLAVGVLVRPRVRVGASLAWSRLALEDDRAGAVSAEDGHLRLTTGVLVHLVGADTRSLHSLRLGVSYAPGFDWAATAAGGRLAQDGPETVAIRRPSLLTVGLGWRASDRMSFAAQGDFIRYSEVVDALRRNAGAGAEGFNLPDTIEPRIGTEFGAPLWCGCGVVKMRLGLHYQSPGTLRYRGADAVLAQAFTPGAWRTVATAGGSFFTEFFTNAVRLDLDARDLFDERELSFGIVWRF
jgi:hypothetical protein